MPENIKALRRRIRSIKNTAKITRAMEMVSAAKLRRTQQAMSAAKPFTRKLEEVLGRLSESESAKSNPYFEKRAEGKRLLVLITADRGLCGAFNANLIKAAKRMLAEDPELKLFLVCRKGRDWAVRNERSRVVGEIVDFGGGVSPAKAEELGRTLLGFWESREYREITILAAEFVSSVLNRPKATRFLPVEQGAFGATAESHARAGDYLLEPSPDRVFEAIMPRYLKSMVYLSLAETFTCEHSSRMMAMNNATKNCKELVDSLTLRANKARQAAITTEIIEIVSGAEALKG